MRLLNEVTIEIKKSKFIGLYYEVETVEEVNAILENLKKEHKKAKHMPYAYKLNNTAKKTDDKEPSGTAGLPIYNTILQNNLNNVLIVVIRYFGGIKLGSGPLMRAYSSCAKETIKIN